MTRGLRNNNPGNIRKDGTHWKGEVEPSRDAAFKQFESMAWGYRAMFKCLNTYSRKYGLDTIRKMISRWHPERERHGCIYPYGIRIVRRPGKRMDHGNQPRCDDPDSRSYVARRKWR